MEREKDHAGHVGVHIFKGTVSKKVILGVPKATRKEIKTMGSQEEERMDKEKDGVVMEKVGKA